MDERFLHAFFLSCLKAGGSQSAAALVAYEKQWPILSDAFGVACQASSIPISKRREPS